MLKSWNTLIMHKLVAKDCQKNKSWVGNSLVPKQIEMWFRFGALQKESRTATFHCRLFSTSFPALQNPSATNSALKVLCPWKKNGWRKWQGWWRTCNTGPAWGLVDTTFETDCHRWRMTSCWQEICTSWIHPAVENLLWNDRKTGDPSVWKKNHPSLLQLAEIGPEDGLGLSGDGALHKSVDIMCFAYPTWSNRIIQQWGSILVTHQALEGDGMCQTWGAPTLDGYWQKTVPKVPDFIVWYSDPHRHPPSKRET